MYMMIMHKVYTAHILVHILLMLCYIYTYLTTTTVKCNNNSMGTASSPYTIAIYAIKLNYPTHMRQTFAAQTQVNSYSFYICICDYFIIKLNVFHHIVKWYANMWTTCTAAQRVALHSSHTHETYLLFATID